MKTISRRKQVLALLPALLAGALVTASRAQDAAGASVADAVRGGWIADIEGVRHIFVLKVRGTVVSGIYCAVDCSDPTRLAFIEQGKLRPDGASFRAANPSRGERATMLARVVGGELELTISNSGLRPALPRQLRLHRDPRKPAVVPVEELFRRRGVTSGPLMFAPLVPPYVPARPNEKPTAAALRGLWVWSHGPGRQNFIFEPVADRVLGVVCGPCDNPYTFGVLDNFAVEGDTLTFDIVHEDWGLGIEFGPYENHATATLSRNEIHLRTSQQNGPREIQGELVLVGPLRLAPR